MWIVFENQNSSVELSEIVMGGIHAGVNSDDKKLK